MTSTVVASFYRDDPAALAELPWPVNYRDALAMLDASVRLHGCEHICITDEATDRAGLPCDTFVMQTPGLSLMQAFVRGQAELLADEASSGSPSNVVFVGADMLMWSAMPDMSLVDWDLLVTSRPALGNYGRINNGCVIVPAPSVERVARVWDAIADATGPDWGDDQRALEAALSPIPDSHGAGHRQGLVVAFAPMDAWNYAPEDIGETPEPAPLFLHFKGARKPMQKYYYGRLVRIAEQVAA
jgi:hypothetical protein